MLDYAIWPLLFFGPNVAAVLLLDRGVPEMVVQVLVIGVAGFGAYGLERIRPEHPAQSKPDLPVWMEGGHFLIGVQLGFFAAYAACLGIAKLVHFSYWPTGWPLALQIITAVVLYEGTSYWQHRYFHRSKRFWGFHALHHHGANLNILRGLRFHAVDIAVPTFLGYLPLIVLGVPEKLIVILNILISVFGVTQHANVRMRTPKWLDAIICTPVLHRRHHALTIEESECNYGTTVMLWDHLFGTFRFGKTPDGPENIGIENDNVPRTFWKQVFSPFKGG